ncbi:MAG: pseudouridine synthase [archaeon GB-1867-035]|nr:pseudouridine synthase [Candidatus Culexmicrobium profundum]
MPSSNLYKLRKIADYQFGLGIGNILFPENIEVKKSKKTGKIKEIYYQGKLLATKRPKDGFFALSIEGAKRILKAIEKPRLRVIVKNEVATYIMKGRNVFAKHIVNADPNIRPGSEVIIVDENDNLLAIGKAILNGEEMLAFKTGIAVKVRKGIKE